MKFLVLLVAVLAVGTVSADLLNLGGLLNTVSNTAIGTVDIAVSGVTGILLNITNTLAKLTQGVQSIVIDFASKTLSSALNQLGFVFVNLSIGVQKIVVDLTVTIGQTAVDSISVAIASIELLVNQLIQKTNFYVSVQASVNDDIIFAGITAAAQSIVNTILDVVKSQPANGNRAARQAALALQVVLQAILQGVNDIFIKLGGLFINAGLEVSTLFLDVQASINKTLESVNGIVASIRKGVNVTSKILCKALRRTFFLLKVEVNPKQLLKVDVKLSGAVKSSLASYSPAPAPSFNANGASKAGTQVSLVLGAQLEIVRNAYITAGKATKIEFGGLNVDLDNINAASQSIMGFIDVLDDGYVANAGAAGGLIDTLNFLVLQYVAAVEIFVDKVISLTALITFAELGILLKTVVVAVVTIAERLVAAVESLLTQLASSVRGLSLSALKINVFVNLGNALNDREGNVAITIGALDVTVRRVITVSTGKAIFFRSTGVVGGLLGTLNGVSTVLGGLTGTLKGLTITISALAEGVASAAYEIVIGNMVQISVSLNLTIKGLFNSIN